MSNFLRSIGFSDLSKFDLSQLRDSVQINFNKHRNINVSQQKVYVEYYKNCGDSIGLILNGIIDHDEIFHPVQFFAHAESDFNTHLSSFSLVSDTQGPLVFFKDKNTNNQIVFTMINTLDFIRDEKKFMDNVNDPKKDKNVNFTALSLGGKVILPASKSVKQIQKKEIVHSNMFILEPSLGMGGRPSTKEIYTTKKESLEAIRDRLQQEDFFSVVDSYLLPSNAQTDHLSPFYDILGTIKSLKEITNTETGENIYRLTVETTTIPLQVFINKKDLIGMPIVGMRFMGNGKLQGTTTV